MRHTNSPSWFDTIEAARRSHPSDSLCDKAIFAVARIRDYAVDAFSQRPFKTFFLTVWIAFFLGLLARG